MTKEEWEEGPAIQIGYLYPYLNGNEDTLKIYRTLSKSSKK